MTHMPSSVPSIPEKVAGETVSSDQQAYLDGFFTGLKNRGVSFANAEPEAGPQPKRKAKIIPEEKMKRELHPFDAFPILRKRAKGNEAPEKEDVFRFKWNGLFWLGPVHEGYMCRLRMPGGTVSSSQMRELASITDDIAWGYLQITTRNNFQLRVVKPKDTPELIRRLQDCGLTSRGAGADNLRNFTASPTAGFDPHELIDVMPHIKDLAHYIVNNQEFYDLPRKFNVSMDGGGLCKVAEDTNDIGLRAIQLSEPVEGHPLHGKVKAGVYFKILLGGVTGHQEFAEDCGVICRPEDATEVIAALTRTYIRNGNRSNRGKSRLIYLLKEWGVDKFLAEAEEIFGEPLLRLPEDDVLINVVDKPEVPHAHLGLHPQKQAGMNWLGVYVPVGLLQSEEARVIADVSERFGNGEMRLTIYQNIIIPNIPEDQVEAAKAALAKSGLRCEASLIRGGVAACTGNRYCKFASSDTKGHALEVVDYLERRIILDQPINIHVTGCPHSCAQHYIGDIGLLACKVKVEDQDEPVEGYHIFVGGGFGTNQKTLGRQLFKSVPAGDDLNRKMHTLLVSYMKHRLKKESFISFTTRHDIGALETLVLSEEEVAA